jgi:biopolymer transport protein ExbB
MGWLTDARIPLISLVTLGGWLMLPLFLCSLAALGVLIERWVTFARCRVDVDQLTRRVVRLLGEDRALEGLEICRETPGPAAKVLEVGLLMKDRPVPEVRTLMADSGKAELLRLERHLPWLATIAQVAPLLGLLGTVSGMIEVFQAIEAAEGQVAVSDLAGGIWQALLTTAGGLIVAIFSVVGHHFFARKIDQVVADVESAATALLETLREKEWSVRS